MTTSLKRRSNCVFVSLNCVEKKHVEKVVLGIPAFSGRHMTAAERLPHGMAQNSLRRAVEIHHKGRFKEPMIPTKRPDPKKGNSGGRRPDICAMVKSHRVDETRGRDGGTRHPGLGQNAPFKQDAETWEARPALPGCSDARKKTPWGTMEVKGTRSKRFKPLSGGSE